jgi:hypothetical protein
LYTTCTIPKNYFGMRELRWPARVPATSLAEWHTRRTLPQAAQKDQTSHPPNPGAPRRALSRQGRSERLRMIPSKLARVPCPWDARMSPTPRASNEDPRLLIPLLKGVTKAALHCAHRTSTVSSCAFCEQEGHLAAPSPCWRTFSAAC